MNFALAQDDSTSSQTDSSFNEQLRMESGWMGVSTGLSGILLGYIVIIVGVCIGLGLIFLAIGSVAAAPKGKEVSTDSLWALLGGFAVIALIGMVGLGMIVRGQWICLMHVPERHNARWLMFASLTAVIMGPVLNVTFGISILASPPAAPKGPKGLGTVAISRIQACQQLGSSSISVASYVLFVLFLRAVALCFRDSARIAHINFHLLCWGVLTGGGVFLMFFNPQLIFSPLVILILAGGSCLTFIWYLYLLLSVQTCINEGVRYLRPPLER